MRESGTCDRFVVVEEIAPQAGGAGGASLRYYVVLSWFREMEARLEEGR